MIRRIINSRYLVVTMLVIAQLGIALHAIEHGVGQHAHNGVPCLYGATDDDDVLAPPPSAVTPQPVACSTARIATEQIIDFSDTGTCLPPATGPPILS